MRAHRFHFQRYRTVQASGYVAFCPCGWGDGLYDRGERRQAKREWAAHVVADRRDRRAARVGGGR